MHPTPPETAGWLRPDWSRDDVAAVMTTRRGGASVAPWDGFNLGDHVGDAPAAVALNRVALGEAIGAQPVFLRQVHGTRVVRLGAADAAPGAPTHEADASLTTLPGVACTILVADCLPVLFAAPAGRGVAAAHAGWRGLAGGVLEATLAALCEAAACGPHEVVTWLGVGIGAARFEVGADVLAAFGGAAATPPRHFSSSSPRADGRPAWCADLSRLAADRLRHAGVLDIGKPAPTCSVEDASRFFSFRRDGTTGRMAAAVWLCATDRRRR